MAKLEGVEDCRFWLYVLHKTHRRSIATGYLRHRTLRGDSGAACATVLRDPVLNAAVGSVATKSGCYLFTPASRFRMPEQILAYQPGRNPQNYRKSRIDYDSKRPYSSLAYATPQDFAKRHHPIKATDSGKTVHLIDQVMGQVSPIDKVRH